MKIAVNKILRYITQIILTGAMLTFLWISFGITFLTEFRDEIGKPPINVFVGIQSYWQNPYTANFLSRQIVELYSFSGKYKLDIEIMTNSEYAKKKIEHVLNPIYNKFDHGCSISISKEYTGLDFPWGNRQMIKKAFDSDKYEYFIIAEDDLLITEEVLDSWIADTNILAIDGVCRRAIQRIEWRQDEEYLLDEFVSSDEEMMKLVKCKNGRLFYYPRNPYFAMSLYRKIDLQKWINSPCWNKDGNPTRWATREAAVSGSNLCFEPLCIPIVFSNASTVSSDNKSFVTHLSNKYVHMYSDLATAVFSKMKPNEIWPNHYNLAESLKTINYTDNECIEVSVIKK
jgi:hypothetical protein